jgi:Nif-specific regulatory protein
LQLTYERRQDIIKDTFDFDQVISMSSKERIYELEKALNELETVNRVLGRVCQVGETNHIMTIIVEELVKFSVATQGVINLVHQQDETVSDTVVRDAGPHPGDERFVINDLVAGWVLTHRQLVRIDDADDDERFPELSSDGGQYKSLVCCPMQVRGKIIGLTSLVRDKASGPFDEGQCRIIGIIASQSAQILSNALLLQELARKNQLLELSQQALHDENARLQEEVSDTFAFENIIGQSPAMKRVLTLASKVSANDIPVLITGPTGTGKELIARAVHYNSRRRERPFVIKNCGVKTESLLESELFGHVKGAFTGASRSKPGLFKEAEGGTIFLDEIGDAPMSTQVAILRVLETGEIRPVGADRIEYVDVRVISATNRDLKNKISDGDFREDLYYRLNTVTIDMPALNRRLDDIPLLVHHCLNKLKVKLGYDRLSISPEAMTTLMKFNWPGNVRQLQHEIERAAVICESGGTIDIAHLSREIRKVDSRMTDGREYKGQLREVVEQVEREMISDTLTATQGNILKSSQLLGLTRKGLKDKLARFGIDPGTFAK